MELIHIVELKERYTQVPNALIWSGLPPEAVLALCRVLSEPPSKVGRVLSARTLADYMGLKYDSRPHRRAMQALRSAEVVTSSLERAEGYIVAERLTLNLNKLLDLKPAEIGENVSKHTGSCETTDPVKANKHSGSCETTDPACETHENFRAKRTNNKKHLKPEAGRAPKADGTASGCFVDEKQAKLSHRWRKARTAAELGNRWCNPESGQWFAASEFAEKGLDPDEVKQGEVAF